MQYEKVCEKCGLVYHTDDTTALLCYLCRREEVKALDVQEGGSHYKDFSIQPIEFITKNKLGFIEGNVIKYVCRHREKGKAEDVKKAIHYLQMLLELEYQTT